jgi:CRISPR/Cas system-associated endonuclease Cas1
LASIAELYKRNAAHVRKQVRAAAQNKTDLTFYARWLWRGIYHLTRFAERHKEWYGSIIALRDQLNNANSGLIQHLHIVARWAELYTRSSKEG